MIRVFNHYLSVRLVLLTFVEALTLFQSVIIGFNIRFIHDSAASSPPLAEAMVFSILTLMTMSAVGLYQIREEPFRVTVHRLLVSVVLSIGAISFIFYLIPQLFLGRGVLAISSAIAILSLLFLRILFFRLTEIGLPKRRVLVIGGGSDAEGAIRALQESSPRSSVKFVGLYPVDSERQADGEFRRVDHEPLRRMVDELHVTEIVLALRERRGGVLPLRQLLDMRLRGLKVMDIQSFYEREQGVIRIDSMRASWMIFSNGFDKGIARDIVKRLFDIAISCLMIVLTLPIMLIAALAVLVEDGLPVLYSQERVGERGRVFRILKFRTMYRDAESDGQPRWAGSSDKRITRVGRILRRTRIDELPQLLNVLRGDMSFVGPRPERPFFVGQLVEQIPFYDVRHSLKPGVTGWAQVRYPYGASVEESREKLQYDLYYVKNHSLFLDLMILVETVHVVIFGRGAR
jgi:sugar transferase (PEP-CTERM system associated)